jgi:hypothetical protein
MSIALLNRIKELEARLDEQRQHNVEMDARIAELVTRVALLEAAQRVRKAPQAA